jgi:hypothetical protein
MGQWGTGTSSAAVFEGMAKKESAAPDPATSWAAGGWPDSSASLSFPYIFPSWSVRSLFCSVARVLIFELNRDLNPVCLLSAPSFVFTPALTRTSLSSRSRPEGGSNRIR